MRRGAAADSNQSKTRKPSPLRCGVYLIRHRASGKGYVGSSASMEKAGATIEPETEARST
jgi:hypothetical protein